jgi:archaeosine synthase
MIPDDIEAVVVPNAFELRKDARKLVDSVIRIREKIGYNRLLIMLGIAEPSTAALLSYMGVDVFDDSLVAAAGSGGIRLIPEGEIRCGTDRDVQVENIADLEKECGTITVFTESGRLRELVDQRAAASPSSTAILRIFDDAGYRYQEECCSTVGTRFACNTTQALRRPDLKIYREKISETYRRPEHKRILLLLSCSAKKPYHISKTHKAFSSAIHTAQHDTLVHEVIVTSPLGIVPRELDVFYPANSYDIPVTGEWKCQEKEMIRSMVSGILSQGYDKVICHLGKDAELVEGLAEMEETVVGDPTTPASLKNLDDALRRAAKGMEPVGYDVERIGSVRSILTFQLGQDTADALMDNGSYAIGKFPYWKIMRDDPDSKEKIQLGMLTPERGMISLTIEGAEIVADLGKNIVEMTDFEMKGNLFAVGVVKADPRIRQGDEAVVTMNGNVVAVGVAMMSGREMTELRRGIAVKIRHKKK